MATYNKESSQKANETFSIFQWEEKGSKTDGNNVRDAILPKRAAKCGKKLEMKGEKVVLVI